VRRVSYICGLALIFGFSFSARADELTQYQAALSAYQASNYPLAIKRFGVLVGGEVPKVTSRPLRLESRKYLGVSYLFVGKKNEAGVQFEKLLEEDASYTLDPLEFPSEVVEFFQSIRSKVRSSLSVAPDATAPPRAGVASPGSPVDPNRASQAPVTLTAEQVRELRVLVETEQEVQVHSRWVAAIPFGVGQFQNGHAALGTALAVSQLLLLSASVITFALHSSVSDTPPDEVTDSTRSEEQALRIANWVTSGLFFATAVAGVIDAQARFVPVVKKTRTRPLPSWLQESMDRPPASSARGAPYRF
jgi:hypothetical protein